MCMLQANIGAQYFNRQLINNANSVIIRCITRSFASIGVVNALDLDSFQISKTISFPSSYLNS